MTLDHWPSQEHLPFAFVANFEQALSLDYSSYLPHSLYYHHYFHYLIFRFLVTIVLIIISIGVVIIINVFFLQFTVYIPSTWWCDCSKSATKTLYNLFSMYIYLALSKNTLLCCKFNILQFRKFFDLADTDRLYTFNIYCKGHVYAV